MKQTIDIYKCDICKKEIKKEELLSHRGSGLVNGLKTEDGRTENVAFVGWVFKHLFSRKYFLKNIVFGKLKVIDICKDCNSKISDFFYELNK